MLQIGISPILAANMLLLAACTQGEPRLSAREAGSINGPEGAVSHEDTAELFNGVEPGADWRRIEVERSRETAGFHFYCRQGGSRGNGKGSIPSLANSLAAG